MTPYRRAAGRRESTLERWCVAWARARGVVVSKVTDPVGFMDRAFWLPGGRPLLIEFKDPKGRTAPGRKKLQDHYQDKLRLDGYACAYVDGKEQFLDLMREHGGLV